MARMKIPVRFVARLLAAAAALVCVGAWAVAYGPWADSDFGRILLYNANVALELLRTEAELWRRYVVDVLPGQLLGR